MICQFCQQEATYSPLDTDERLNVDIYFCHTCQAEYLFWRDKVPLSWSLYLPIKDKMYRWTYSYNNVSYLFYVEKPGIPGVKKNQFLKVIKEFRDHIPDITPANFLEKLKTYLIFI